MLFLVLLTVDEGMCFDASSRRETNMAAKINNEQTSDRKEEERGNQIGDEGPTGAFTGGLTAIGRL